VYRAALHSLLVGATSITMTKPTVKTHWCVCVNRHFAQTSQFLELGSCTWEASAGAIGCKVCFSRWQVFSALLPKSGFCTRTVKPSERIFPNTSFSIFSLFEEALKDSGCSCVFHYGILSFCISIWSCSRSAMPEMFMFCWPCILVQI